jgi:hypothetical protein
MTVQQGIETAEVDDAAAAEADEQHSDESPDLAAEVERWKTEARKHEKRARENAGARRELQQLREGNQTEAERVAAAAKEVGRREAQSEFGKRLAQAEIRAALTGVVEDPNLIIDDLDLSRYVDEEGDVDDNAVKGLRAKYAKLFGARKGVSPDTARGTGGRGVGAHTPADDFADTMKSLLGR